MTHSRAAAIHRPLAGRELPRVSPSRVSTKEVWQEGEESLP